MMKKIILAVLAILAFEHFPAAQSQSTVAVQFCPLYLALQNRCPTTTTTTPRTTTRRRTTPAGNGTGESDADATDSCGYPVITFCPETQTFLQGDRDCSSGQTIRIRLTTLGELLIRPYQQDAEAAVGSTNVNALGESLSSVAKTIQATPTQAPLGVTFIPVGQIIG